MKSTSLLGLLVACGTTRSPAPKVASVTCRDLPCLAAHQGVVIDVEGTYVAPADPSRKGRQLRTLRLADGTTVVLHAKHARLLPALDGKRVVVRGVHYEHPIPDRYGIVEATSDPYLVEIYDVHE